MKKTHMTMRNLAARGQTPRGIRAAMHPRWTAALPLGMLLASVAAAGPNRAGGQHAYKIG